MKVIALVGAVALVALSQQSFACGVEGSAQRTDGSKVDNTATVSTSWNSEVAFPKDGYYRLDMGSSACGESADVYVDGNSLGRYTIPSSGFTTVNFTLKGTTNVPVR